jgi:helicase
VQNRIGIGGKDHLTGLVRAKRAMACLLYASNTPLSTLERHLTQHQRDDGVAGAVRSTADRTRDLIPAVIRVFTFLHPDIAIGDVAERTMVRLEIGLPAAHADLGAALGASLTRAQYLSLASQGITTPEQLAAADAAALAVGLSLTKPRVIELQDLLQQHLRRKQENVLAPLLPAPTE